MQWANLSGNIDIKTNNMGEKEEIVRKIELKSQDGIFSKVILTYGLSHPHRHSFPIGTPAMPVPASLSVFSFGLNYLGSETKGKLRYYLKTFCFCSFEPLFN